MSVTDVTNTVQEQGNGVKTAYTFDFKAFLAGDLKVSKVNRTTLVATLLTITTDYTVSLNTITEGGTVTYVVAPLSTEDSFIKRELTFTQSTDVPTEGTIPEDSLNNEYDRSRMIDIQLKEAHDRALLFAESSSLSNIVIPESTSAANRATKLMAWDAAGTALELVTPTTTSSITVKGDIEQGNAAGTPAKLAIGGDKQILVVSTDELAYSGSSLTVDISGKKIGINKASPGVAIDVVVGTGVVDGLNIKSSGATGNTARLFSTAGDDGQLELLEDTGTRIVKLNGSAAGSSYISSDCGFGGQTSPTVPVHIQADASDQWLHLLKSGGTTFQVEYDSNANMNSDPMLRIDNSVTPELALYIADVTGGTRVYLWDDGVVLPDIPHTAIPPTFAVHGDILCGDIVALASNPMTYFIRANTSLAASVTTQLFCARAINNDVNGGAGIVMAPHDGSSVESGAIKLIAYGTGSTNANSIMFQTRSGSGTVASRMVVTTGVVVGSPTGGDKGAGTINTAGDYYKNNTVNVTPDFVFEHYYTGDIVKYKDNEGADKYTGLGTLEEVEAHTKENWRLPRVSLEPSGIFERSDFSLSHLEELYLHIFELNKRIKVLERQSN